MRKSLSEMTLQELWELFPIQLTEHKECWKDWYLEEQTNLLSFLPKTVRISHIGSTAIQAIWAKPIVDIIVEAPLKEHQTIKNRLLQHGYSCMAQDEIRIDFCKGYTPYDEGTFRLSCPSICDILEKYADNELNHNKKIIINKFLLEKTNDLKLLYFGKEE